MPLVEQGKELFAAPWVITKATPICFGHCQQEEFRSWSLCFQQRLLLLKTLKPRLSSPTELCFAFYHSN